MRRFALLAFVLLTGCYNAKMKAPVTPTGEKYSDTGVSFFWGMTNTTTIAAECPHGMAYAEVYHPWWGVFIVAPLTLGIITPLRKVYQCAAPAAAASPAGPQIVVMQAPAAVAPAPTPPSK